MEETESLAEARVEMGAGAVREAASMLQRRPERATAEEVDRHDPTRSVTAKKRHHLTLKGREHLTIEGVRNVDSFDRTEVLLETEQGVLLVRGEDLNIKELSLEGSALVITGFFHSLEYQGEGFAKQSKGFFGRLFK